MGRKAREGSTFFEPVTDIAHPIYQLSGTHSPSSSWTKGHKMVVVAVALPAV